MQRDGEGEGRGRKRGGRTGREELRSNCFAKLFLFNFSIKKKRKEIRNIKIRLPI